MGLVEERPHLHGVVAPEAGRLAEVVDEEPVALLGGDPAGAGVRLAQVALLLEGGHVVAHGGRGHLHAGGPHDVRRPHRLGGVDVLLHDGPEDGGLAFVEHGGSWHSMLPSASAAEQFPHLAGWADAVRRAGRRGDRRRGRRAPGRARPRRRARRPRRPSGGHRRRRPPGPLPRRRGAGAGAGGRRTPTSSTSAPTTSSSSRSRARTPAPPSTTSPAVPPTSPSPASRTASTTSARSCAAPPTPTRCR